MQRESGLEFKRQQWSPCFPLESRRSSAVLVAETSPVSASQTRTAGHRQFDAVAEVGTDS